jgi:hypothetical protein
LENAPPAGDSISDRISEQLHSVDVLSIDQVQPADKVVMWDGMVETETKRGPVIQVQ